MLGGVLLLAVVSLLLLREHLGGRASRGCEETQAALAAGGLDVVDYEADLQIDPVTRTLTGTVGILVRSQGAWNQPLELSAEGLSIEAVREGDTALEFQHEGGSLRIPLNRAPGTGQHRRVSVRYRGQPEGGLHFKEDAFYTAFHTARWMPSRDLPSDKATWTLRLTVPAGLSVIASGKLLTREALQGAKERYTWRLEVPHSAYLLGFVAGKFQESQAMVGLVRLRFLGAGRSEAELKRVFADTTAMFRFFQERAGVPYPFEEYTQVLLPEATPQEVAGHALLEAGYADEVLTEPREDWMSAHELAHQWWGNLVTCGSWGDFWLNEGLTTFMTAAYKEHRWGRDEYDREMALARRRYQRLRARGADRALALPETSLSREVGGPLPYAKGSLVLHLLRSELGEEDFWAGIREFTASHASCAASTSDFRAALEKASGRELGPFFAQWVHGTGVPEIVAQHRVEEGTLVLEVEQSQRVWSLPLTLAIETDAGREIRRVPLAPSHQEFRFPLKGSLKSVRVDAGGVLPFAISHERPVSMLLYQLDHEPDVMGRMDAIEHLVELCRAGDGPQECQGLRDRLAISARDDASRLIRKLAQDAHQQMIAPP
ncbi:M1 family metallopeptidase [Stigmatella sp. ncwal1]|uniref:Aminopeptidase N n=1 Tax=Stigmatella ashevillensis TaxID=2995309 RepID=A0ABT5DAU9_9BACT|nr:M1 family metallopeptidase [Stigmatella ashevillena]MDC0710184.1 M1 family metallopeptidase [Stigmatella ashevillena]